MKRIRCSVAASLDGFMAGAHGGADWIIIDPDIDIDALTGECDTVLVDGRTFETSPTGGATPGMATLTAGPSVGRTERTESRPR